MDGQLQAIFNQAQSILKNDAQATLMSGAQARQQQFAAINNAANANHMLFSGVPKAQQMKYDANTFIPNMSTAVVQSIKNQAENQEAWDKFASQIKDLNSKAAKLESAVPRGFNG